MSDHAVTSRLLRRRPFGHRWAWYCSCGWWITGARPEPLYLNYAAHLKARPRRGGL